MTRRKQPPVLHRPRARLAVAPVDRRAREWRFRHPRPGCAAAGSGGGGGRTGATRILVVDDEPAIRTICRVNLAAEGLDVVEAADGEEALARVVEHQPELVLLDVMMPSLDGWAVAERLAADPATADIPVVFLSARAAAEDRARARRLGAVGYVTKPFDPLTLGRTLEALLERLRRGERDQLREEVWRDG